MMTEKKWTGMDAWLVGGQLGAAVCAMIALFQTTESLSLARKSVDLVESQIKKEQERHLQNHKWQVQPLVMFERGTATLVVSKDKPLDLGSAGLIGRVVNLGPGPAIATKIVWSLDAIDDGGDSAKRTTRVDPDIIFPQGKASLSELPKILTELKWPERATIKGMVTIRCEDIEKNFVRVKQPFTLTFRWDEKTERTTLTVAFDYAERVDWLDLRMM